MTTKPHPTDARPMPLSAAKQLLNEITNSKQEPKVVAYRYEFDNSETEGEPLITLQSHREAMKSIYADFEVASKKLGQQHCDIAKKDSETAELRAVLVGCVEALEVMLLRINKGYDGLPQGQGKRMAEAALTQAQEALK